MRAPTMKKLTAELAQLGEDLMLAQFMLIEAQNAVDALPHFNRLMPKRYLDDAKDALLQNYRDAVEDAKEAIECCIVEMEWKEENAKSDAMFNTK